MKKYYKSIDALPHIFWVFDKKILPGTANIKQKDSTTGDSCHYNIERLSNNVAKKIFINNFDLFEDGKICNNDHPRKFIEEDLKLFENLT